MSELVASRALIVTVPIGVLKADSITFVPTLPSSKRDAIARMGSGLLNKLYLEFPYYFWNPTPDMIGTSQPQKGGFAVWVNMERITGRPILMAFTSGQSALDIEALPDNEIERRAMDRLRRTFIGPIPNPVRRVITRWNTDPFARGSYAHFSVNTRLGDRGILREPVDNKLLFAGEATVDFGFSQVPGAYASGIREANRIIQAYAQ